MWGYPCFPLILSHLTPKPHVGTPFKTHPSLISSPRPGHSRPPPFNHTWNLMSSGDCLPPTHSRHPPRGCTVLSGPGLLAGLLASHSSLTASQLLSPQPRGSFLSSTHSFISPQPFSPRHLQKGLPPVPT